MQSTYSAEIFVVISDEQVREILAQAFAPVDEDPDSQGWLFKSRYTCKFWQVEGGDLQMEIRRSLTQVTDQRWQSANCHTVGLQFTEELGKELCRFLCGAVPITEPEGLRARPTPQAIHEESVPIVGRIATHLFLAARNAATTTVGQ